MRSVSVRLADLDKVKLNLGFVGENEHTHVLFDCKKAFEQYPNAVPSLVVVPPRGDSYPGVVVREGDIVEWVVTDSDLIYHGDGKIQLQFQQGDVIMKSYETRTSIAPSSGATGTIPTPIQNWIAQANAILAEIPDDINSALSAAKASGEFDGDDGVGIASIAKTGTSGLVDTYTITLTNGSHYDIDVTNGTPGQNGVGIQNIEKTSTVGLVDTYTITLTNGDTYPFTVTNGQNGVEIDDTTPAVNKVFSSSKVDEMNTLLLNHIDGADDKIENINDVLKNVFVKKSNEAIFLAENKDFNYSVESTTRVSTNPIYISNGEKLSIKASGFGKYAYSVSSNGNTISDVKAFTQATSIDLVMEGPKYVRFVFAKNNDSTISVNDVSINITNRLDEIESFNKLTPILILNNIDTYLPNGEPFGYLGTLAGSQVSVYDVSNINRAKITRSVSSVSALLSNVLYTGEATGLIPYAVQDKKSAIWENTEGYKYLYLTTKRTDTTFYAKIELTKVTDVGSFPVILQTIEDAKSGYVVSIEKSNIGNSIVCTYGDMYVRNNNGVLQMSSDKGATWNDGFDVSSLNLIKNYHLFANGCIAFFTHQHAYYSEDWEEYHEADVYESDGVTPYVPSTYDNFLCSRDNQERKFIGTQDLHVFGNYGITDENNTRRIIWLSTDNGHSYKVIYEFNIQGNISIRHIHNVVYNKDYDRFLCCTGDLSNQSYVIEINIDGVNTPTFTVKNTGLDYKWAGVAFYGAYVYYCMDNTPGQVKRCKYQDIADISKHEIILDNLPNDPIGLFIGERGDMLVTLTRYRSNGTSNSPFPEYKDQLRMYYSKDRKEFTQFMADKQTRYSGIFYMFNGVNSEGRIITGYWEDRINLEDWNKLPSASLDEMVKKAGFPMAFKPYDRTWEIVPVIDVLCEDVTVASGSSVTIQPKLFPVDASSLAFSIIDYDSSVVSVSGATITGVTQGTTTAKVRSNICYDAYAEITITVT